MACNNPMSSRICHVDRNIDHHAHGMCTYEYWWKGDNSDNDTYLRILRRRFVNFSTQTVHMCGMYFLHNVILVSNAKLLQLPIRCCSLIHWEGGEGDNTRTVHTDTVEKAHYQIEIKWWCGLTDILRNYFVCSMTTCTHVPYAFIETMSRFNNHSYLVCTTE